LERGRRQETKKGAKILRLDDSPSKRFLHSDEVQTVTEAVTEHYSK
jgi:hypothetical protein